MSDARLEGAIHHTYESDSYAMPGAEAGTEVFAATWRIENDDGAWESRSLGATRPDGTVIGEPAEILVGEGAYEGLIAIMEATPVEGDICELDLRGIIFHGAPIPEPYVAD